MDVPFSLIHLCKNQAVSKQVWIHLPMYCKPQSNCGRSNACGFICGTISCAILSLHWSVTHFQMTFELYSGCGMETIFGLVV